MGSRNPPAAAQPNLHRLLGRHQIVPGLSPPRLDRLQPDSAAHAREILETGNRQFCEIVARTQSDHHAESTLVVPCDARLLGVDPGGGAPRQEPFVALVGCADARVPPQMIFQRMSNEMFIIRVAGNGGRPSSCRFRSS